MFSKKQLILISFALAALFHFIFYFNLYGPSGGIFETEIIYLLALISATIMLFIYFGTYWRASLKGESAAILFDLLMLWVLVSFVRSLVQLHNVQEIRGYLFNNYLGLSLFPILFFIAGVNSKYFFEINRALMIYTVMAAIFSVFFIQFFEFQLFLLLPVFYLIITIPFRRAGGKILILLITISIIIVSFTNRAGLLRILISYSILGAFYLMQSIKINKKLLIFLVFLVLMIPIVSLYLGMKGVSIFQVVLGEDTNGYSQLNPYADTRTFLYYEVFQDIILNKSLVFGKGLNAGYESYSFNTFNRQVVEVGFLQLLLKTGVIGSVLYFAVIISAIFKALGRSGSLFMKALGLLLTGYLIMFFVENVLAYNLLNIIVWFSVGMCYSPTLRGMNSKDFEHLFKKPDTVSL